MNFQELLKAKTCDCGKTHRCSVKSVLIGEGVLEKLPAVLGNYKSILLVADKNTYLVCGNTVAELLDSRIQRRLIYQDDGVLIPNEAAIARLKGALSPETDLILGVGAGVIQDLCKYVSFAKGLPYAIVATAPSMDGYASVGAAMIIGNMKVTYSAHVPEVILGDVNVLKNAPMELIQSGYGDILGKYSCLNDWKLSALINDEYFCEAVYDLTYDMLCKVKDLGPQLLNRDPQAVRLLMEALVGVGIAMAYVGNSRPASGSEHHFAHFFEVVGILNNEPYFPHGIDVACSAVLVQKLRDQILALENLPKSWNWNRDDWMGKIHGVYGAAADGVITLQDKLGWYEKDWLAIYRAKWPEIKAVLEEAPSAAELTGYLESVNLDIRSFEKQYGMEKLQNAVWYAKDLKDRYTVLWLYYTLFLCN